MAGPPSPLRTWIAWSFLEAPVQGTTKPLFYDCLNPTTEEFDTFLVKALDSEETMAREVVGNRLAQVAGLRTPEPAIVFVSRTIATQVNTIRKEAGKFSNQQPGRAAGARQFVASNVLSVVQVPDVWVEEALRLYIFDMLALHTDRTEQNPNCAVTDDGLVVYDFERCFVEDDEEDVREWCVWQAATNGFGSRHMFYTRLQKSKGVRSVARRVIKAMTDARLNACLHDLPRSWMPEGRRIVEHVRDVREHADEFVENIVRSLDP